MPTGTRRRRSFFANAGLLCVTVVFFFGITELGLRLVGIGGMPKTPPIYRKSDDSSLSYQLKPNLREVAFRSTVVTDRRGLRSEEIHPGKPSIAILGDSIAFGYGLENDRMLSARLNALLDKKFNVVNAAAPGYGLSQEAAMYKNSVEVLHPSSLILVFHWNDLTDTEPSVLDDEGNLHPPGWTPDQIQCHPVEDGMMELIPGRCWLDLHSALYRTLKKVVAARTEQNNLHRQEEEYRQNAFGDEVTDAQLRTYERTLAAFVRTLPRSMNMLFVIWPEKRLHIESAQKLREIAERLDFRVLNLYEVFGNKAESLSWDTVHPSAKTVEEAAGVIKAALGEWKLLQ